MATIFRRKGIDGKPAKNYSIKYKDERGKWRTVAGCATKELTKQKAHDLEAVVLNRKAGRIDPFEEPKKHPLSEHLDAYSRHLQTYKNDSADHIAQSRKRISSIFDGCGFTSIDDLAAFDAADKVARYLENRRLAAKRPLTVQTSNHYLTALKGFCRWAAESNRMPPSTLLVQKKVKKVVTEDDDKRVRRAATTQQFAKLISAAQAGPRAHGLTGEQRAWLYMVAAYSGFRASELATLTPGSFRLTDPPAIVVKACYTKNKTEAWQPIRPDFAKMLKPWLRGKRGLLWPSSWWNKAAEMLRTDLAAAKIPYETPEGILDFHALRVTYITNLARAGVHPSIAQRLARHSSISLTMGIYTKLNSDETAAGLKGLPIPPQIGAPNAHQTRAG